MASKRKLIHHIFDALNDNPDWSRALTSTGELQAKIWAWSTVAFPGWARPTIPRASNIRIPVMKPLVKSKCFDDGGKLVGNLDILVCEELFPFLAILVRQHGAESQPALHSC